MPVIIALSGSPSPTSRTAELTEDIADRLRADAHDVTVVRVRDLPAAALLGGDVAHPAIAAVVADIAAADGVVVTTPIYKAAYTGVLKTLLDLLPQFALTGKAVLPVVTGGSPAHVLALDYALRPVLAALGAHHVLPGWFVLDKHIERRPDGVVLAPEAEGPLSAVVKAFESAVRGLAVAR